MKKLLTLMLALSVLFMTSCGNAGISETTATQEENIEYTDYSPTGEVLSFGDNYLSGFQGHIHFEKEIDDETEIYVKTDLVPVESVTVLGKTYQLKYVETYSYYGGEMQRDQYDILNGEREGSILKVQDGKVVFFTDIAARIDMSLERTEEELVDAVEEAIDGLIDFDKFPKGTTKVEVSFNGSRYLIVCYSMLGDYRTGFARASLYEDGTISAIADNSAPSYITRSTRVNMSDEEKESLIKNRLSVLCGVDVANINNIKISSQKLEKINGKFGVRVNSTAEVLMDGKLTRAISELFIVLQEQE